MDGPRPIELYVRLLTSTVLAVGIVGAAVYSLLHGGDPNSPLIIWGATIVGVYFGGTATLAGHRAGVRAVNGHPGAKASE